MHRNKINKKIYIGITGNIPEYRWNEGKRYKQNRHFYSSIKKYGWNNFDHIILYENLSKKEAEIKEIELIKHYDSTNKEKGYNMQKGGNLYFSKTVYQYDRKSGELIEVWENTVSIEKKLGIPNANISMVCLGNTKTAGGFYFSYVDYGEFLPKSIIEKINKNDCHIRVAQYGLEGNFIRIYNTLSEACAQLNVKKINLKSKTSFGYIWKKLDSNLVNYPEKLSKEEVEIKTNYKKLNKRCCQYDKNGKFIKSFESTVIASKSLGISQSVIASACRGTSLTAGGFYWKYEEENNEIGMDLTVKDLELLKQPKGGKSVIQYDKNGNFIRKFNSITNAANHINCSTNEISKVCMRKNKSVHGFVFRYEDDSITVFDLINIKKHSRKRKVAQYDMNGNCLMIYDSLAQAQRETGTKDTSIVNCCRGKYKSANNFKWEYVN